MLFFLFKDDENAISDVYFMISELKNVILYFYKLNFIF